MAEVSSPVDVVPRRGATTARHIGYHISSRIILCYALGVETGVDFFPNLVGILGETGAASVESTAAAL